MKVVGGLLAVGVLVLAVWLFAFWLPHRSPGPRVVSDSGGFSLCLPAEWEAKEQPDGSVTAQKPGDAAEAREAGMRVLAFTVPELQRAALLTMSSNIARLRGQQSLVSLSLSQLPDPRLAVFLALELAPADPSEWDQWPDAGRTSSGLRADCVRLLQSVPISVPAASGKLVVFQTLGPAGAEAHVTAVMEKSDRLTIVDIQMPQAALAKNRPLADRIVRSFRWFH